ncbi:ABC transporter substrate-binding protein [Streptomyces sp. SID13031]|uniref:ABC transporter substrate-binding protein n=1 Tax=Streptomyces sp. SID13031 TaxID=2706046 RepID=UPI0013C87812|nr:ABC transporter substrate-binding protein [Streptomyces sp. SID13031]NEA33810.1 ABC transporter substrate-binding protein [Streptomyces sp. SID13031]
MSALRTTLAVCGVLVLSASGCGSDSLSGSTTSPSTGTSSSQPTTGGSADPELAAALPAKIKTAGKITVGVDATYPPNEFLQGGKTVAGMDVDVFGAVAKKFGVTVDWQPAGFDTIITGVQSGKYDLGISSFTINDKRKAQVNMVSYFSAGTQWATAAGNPKKVDPADACGKTIAVQKGTTQLEDDLPVKQAACKTAGKPAIKLVIREKQDAATADVATGKADAMLADSPVVLYAAKQSAGKIEALGEIYDAAPYGYVVPKAQTDFAAALAKALKAIDADGTYKAALSTWGNESGAITDFAVNP